MANLRFGLFVAASLLSASITLAADNTKQIEAALRNYAEGISRVDDVHDKAADKLRNEATTQLIKIANRAFADKDRLAETNAWKAVLSVDNEHAKAVQYFKDLGTLDATLAEVTKASPADLAKLTKLQGDWIAYAGFRTEFVHRFTTGGIVEGLGPDGRSVLWKSTPLTLRGTGVVTEHGGEMHTYTPVGDRLILEAWDVKDFNKTLPKHVQVLYRR